MDSERGRLLARCDDNAQTPGIEVPRVPAVMQWWSGCLFAALAGSRRGAPRHAGHAGPCGASNGLRLARRDCHSMGPAPSPGHGVERTRNSSTSKGYDMADKIIQCGLHVRRYLFSRGTPRRRQGHADRSWSRTPRGPVNTPTRGLIQKIYKESGVSSQVTEIDISGLKVGIVDLWKSVSEAYRDRKPLPMRSAPTPVGVRRRLCNDVEPEFDHRGHRAARATVEHQARRNQRPQGVEGRQAADRAEVRALRIHRPAVRQDRL